MIKNISSECKAVLTLLSVFDHFVELALKRLNVDFGKCQPISDQCFDLIPPVNSRKPLGFLLFSGRIKWKHLLEVD